MASFDLIPGEWVQIIAPEGSKDQQIQVNYGQVLLVFGEPTADTLAMVADRVQYASAGVEVQARATTPAANVTIGDH